MASSENLASIEPWAESWAFRPVVDSWFAEYIARDADTLTRALQKSLSGASAAATPPEDAVSPFMAVGKPDAAAPPTPTVSGLSGSDQESAPKRQRGAAAPSVTGRVTKRKSRASKRSQTTFITADPANFRQMVQQVTGVRFSGSQVPMAPVLKPEPQRIGGCGSGVGRLPAGGGCLPTLDTSAFLLDHHQHQVVGHNSAAAGGPGVSGPGPLPFAQPVGVVDATSLASSGLDFETFSSFPTLESWKVM